MELDRLSTQHITGHWQGYNVKPGHPSNTKLPENGEFLPLSVECGQGDERILCYSTSRLQCKSKTAGNRRKMLQRKLVPGQIIPWSWRSL